MLTWICPQCGREVPPSYSECPACAENRQRAAQGLPPAGVEPAPPPPPVWQPAPILPGNPQQYIPSQQQQWPTTPVPPQPSYTLPETTRGKGLPTWLVTLLVAAIAVGVIYGGVKLLGNRNGSSADSGALAMDQASVKTDSSNPYAKFLEVTGLRIVEDEKRHARAQFLVVNHSTAELPDLELRVTISTTTSKPGDDPLAVLTVKTGGVPANGSKDVSAPLKTKLRAYEMPDWQFLKASFAIAASR